MKFKAAMFDFDGTITEKGQYAPPQQLADALVDLSQKIPIAFCTGRQLESFERRGLNELLEEINDENRDLFLKNLFLFAENGSIGYRFNTDKNDFEEFYRIEWPVNFIDADKLRATLDEDVKEYGSVYYNAHRIVVVIRTRLHDTEDRDVDEVYDLSEKIYEVTIKTLRKFDADFERYVHVGNSGIGVVICPANGDKDTGIKKFAKFLNEKRGLKIDKNAREIMVVGDRPMPGGNDYYFLNGRYGTPFTVGNFDSSQKFPKPVLGAEGKHLLHAEGTLFLISQILRGTDF